MLAGSSLGADEASVFPRQLQPSIPHRAHSYVFSWLPMGWGALLSMSLLVRGHPSYYWCGDTHAPKALRDKALPELLSEHFSAPGP